MSQKLVSFDGNFRHVNFKTNQQQPKISLQRNTWQL